ncbi:FliI/YscN family ATPase [Vibrio crassostreae]|uniref:FliI/YscN family ATPase n=1 Tax=Vibrio crassostreae TaxID=246167 RepID=UPI001B30C836|nr:FliI/YscN family ATPase [Vibrio crassostreae]
MPNIINNLSKNDAHIASFSYVGKVKNAIGTTIEAYGLKASVGARCKIINKDTSIIADVIGFNNGITKLQPLTKPTGISPDSSVRIVNKIASIEISDNLLGKAIDPLGNILISDGVSTPKPTKRIKLNGDPVSVSERTAINKPFNTGIRAINSMIPLGVGQRVGLFAGTGVGKSVLLGMITKSSEADIVVIGLVGERGREVTEFYNEILDDESRKKAIVVAAPADSSPILRLQCPEAATAIAEHYREQGLKVLLLIDSVTRYAQAQREVALASGEAPATKGYPPSVFSKLPSLIERSGKTKKGSITAIYTVLTEGDDLNDPIADAARGVLDGHIILSRELAGRGIYPAIDVTNSISRLSHVLITPNQLSVINEIKSYFHTLNENIDLVGMGLIEKGKNKKLDIAVKNEDVLFGFIKQEVRKSETIKESVDKLVELNMKIKEL